MDFPRAMWLRIETLHAVTYFGEETDEVRRAAGLTGFWMGYFGFRASPMGRVDGGVVEATFFNFAPTFVDRWVPDVWDHASPDSLVAARAQAAASTLRRVDASIDALAQAINAELERAVAACPTAGRPLFAANRRVPLSDDPVERLWQLCTSLREHRGDGHVAALTTAGLDGLEAHVLIALEHGAPVEDLQRARGWTPDDWAAAVARCRSRGLVGDDGALTDAGRSVRDEVESSTDRLAMAPWSPLDADGRAALLAALHPAAAAVAASGVIRYPNPMSLPRVT